MNDNLPAEVAAEVRAGADRVSRRAAANAVATVARRELPQHAYRRPGLGDLPLSRRIEDAMNVLNEALVSVRRFEELTPRPLECSVCGRNLAGWPEQVLVDHWFQHTYVQRKLAAFRING